MVPPSPADTSPVEWLFGETEADAVAWADAPELLHVYVDFRLPDTPRGHWHRVIAVTHSWVRAQLQDKRASYSWPSALVVPDGSLDELRAAIQLLLGRGGATIIAREAKLITDAERLSSL